MDRIESNRIESNPQDPPSDPLLLRRWPHRRAQELLKRKAAGETIEMGMGALLDAVVEHVPPPRLV